jgi:hypothetical protein
LVRLLDQPFYYFLGFIYFLGFRLSASWDMLLLNSPTGQEKDALALAVMTPGMTVTPHSSALFAFDCTPT